MILLLPLPWAMRPYSPQFDDHYWSASGGAAEKAYVFLQGNNLPQRFAGAGAFTVAELGFGTGLNFLLTAQLWQTTAPHGAQLTFISYEQFPFSAQELTAIHTAMPQHLQPLSQAFLAAYTPAPGWHRFSVSPTITLHLFVGNAAQGISTQPQPAHAWFLDGFSPSKNPQLWQPSLIAQVAHHTHPQGTFATYSAARLVKESLTLAGFGHTRIAGFPPKRHMLVGGLLA